MRAVFLFFSPCATALVFRVSLLRRSQARALPLLNLKKERYYSQSVGGIRLVLFCRSINLDCSIHKNAKKRARCQAILASCLVNNHNFIGLEIVFPTARALSGYFEVRCHQI